MRVLILTSEPLNPANTLPSTFELSQAKLLSRVCDVAICSVDQAPAEPTTARAWLGLALRSPGRAISTCLRQLSAIGGSPVRRHLIDGVAVYEGVAAPGGRTFEQGLARWVEAAQAAFATYSRSGGPPDVVHAHGRFLNAGAAALAIRRATGTPYVYTDHSSAYQRGLAPAEAVSVLREVIANAADYSTVSPALAHSVDRFLGAPLRTARTLPNVIDAIFERTPPRPSPEAPPYVFVNVASLNANKGVDVLIRAFGQAFQGAQEYRLEICGEGDARDSLAALINELGLGVQVRLLGELSKAEVLERLDGAHALVVASHVETFGVVLIEALARGRPVVATRCGGPETIVTKANGLLLPPGDVDALAGALQRMAKSGACYDSAKLRDGAIAEYGEAAFLQRAVAMYRAAA